MDPGTTTTSDSQLPWPATIAFYLPQFHPIPENDAAWGPGFTEWHNVAAARPRFHGHQQPVLPGQLGFYDLRLSDTRRAQIELARTHGVDGFCWYHFWFDGRRLLHEPFDRMRQEPAEDFPFMLCWANESWTREWSGHSGSVIVKQVYSKGDDERHIQFLLEIFSDSRYIRVDGKPIFLVYQPFDMPDVKATTDLWRRCAERAGFPGLFLLGVESFRNRLSDPAQLGLDGVVEQQPDLRLVRPAWRAAPRVLASKVGIARRYPTLVRFPYAKLRESALRRLRLNPDSRRCPTVSPGWDNSPRRRGRGAVVITGTTPDGYEDWLRQTLTLTPAPFVFVNAWNEWAEGAHLEPDSVNGMAYLEAHRRGLERAWKP